jgi:hypothetical protein
VHLLLTFCSPRRSGKSLIIGSLVQHLYDPCDVGTIGNNFEKTFGLAAIYDKFIWTAPEVRNDFTIDQAVFQSMVSGESVSVSIKHQTARSVQWTAPGIMAGNVLPGFSDSHGSLGRRWVVFLFVKTVADADMSKKDKISAEFPLILQKISRAYLEFSARFGNRNLWADMVLPDYFWQQRRNMAASLNSVDAFLQLGGLEFGPDLFVPLEDFKLGIKTFEQISGFKHMRLTEDMLRGPLQVVSCHIVREMRAYRHHPPKLRAYVIGCDLD